MHDKLFIFDCDGVLVDSEFISSRVFAEALAAYGYPLTTEDSIRRFTGVSAEAARHIVMQESAVDVPENYWALQQPALSAAMERELQPLQKPVLEMLAANRIARCVASNSSTGHIVKCLELTQQLSYFSETAIFSAQQVANGKPSPDLFLFACEQMGYQPHQCVVIEDSQPGIEAAMAAGMPVLAFLGGSHAAFDWYEQDLQKYGLPCARSSQELLLLVQQL